jgi:nucleolar complex protein 3
VWIDDSQTSDMCLDTLNAVFRVDTTGVPSLEIVRILNRMIKERRFQINPNVLSCLLNLRLKSELSIRASETKADRGDSVRGSSRSRSAKGHSKGKVADKIHLSKKSRKAFKERKEIEKEIREAEAIVDKEERAVTVGAYYPLGRRVELTFQSKRRR